MPYRLQRLERVFVQHPIYFLTACTVSRAPILANESVQKAFENFAAEAANRGNLVGRHVIMPDHIHFFLAPKDGTSLGTWMKSLKNSLSRVLRGLGHSSPHWQKGYFDHILRSERSHEEKWLYVRENPVRAQLVGDWRKWSYSGEINSLCFPKN